MVDSFTDNRNIVQPLVGGDSGTWGGILNSGVMAQLDLILGATQAISITSADVTLSIAQWNNAAINLTGALTGDHNLILPFNVNSATAAVGGLFVVANNTTGAFKVTVKTQAIGSTGVTVAQGTRAFLYSDTVNVWNADDAKLQIIPYAGNPNGHVAGTAASINNPPSCVWDYTNASIYFCTTTGNAASAVWTLPVSPVNRGFNAPINLQLSVTHTGGNLLQVAVKTLNGADASIVDPIVCAFQTVSGSNTTGSVATLNITSALSMTTNAVGASLGSSSNTPFRIWFAVFNNGGTAVLAMLNASTSSGVLPVAEQGIASTTGVSGSATSAGVWYTPNGTTLSNKAYRLIGYCEYTSGLVTPGTYVSDPNNTVVFGPGVRKPGDIIQTKFTSTGANTTTSNTWPLGNSVPTTSNGAVALSLSVTPTSPVNIISIRAQAIIGASVGSQGIAFLIGPGSSSALAACIGVAGSTTNFATAHALTYQTINIAAGSTFSLYFGATTACGLNGYNSNPLLGGVANTFMELVEIMG